MNPIRLYMIVDIINALTGVMTIVLMAVLIRKLAGMQQALTILTRIEVGKLLQTKSPTDPDKQDNIAPQS